MASSGNFATFDPLAYKPSSYTTTGVAQGNMKLTEKTGNAALLTMGFVNGDGKYYFEIFVSDVGGSSHMGVCIGNADLNNVTSGKAQIGYRFDGSSATKLVSTAPQSNSSSSSYGDNSTGNNDIVACAVDFTNSTIEFFRNNTSQGSFSWSDANNGAVYYPYVYCNHGVIYLNCGQDSSFVGQKTSGSASASDENGFGDFYYTPPSGFLAMCSANMPISSDIDPAGDDGETENPSKQFGVVTFTGNGSSRTISGLGFQPDMIWGKYRNATKRQYLVDSSRGFTKYLHPSENVSEGTSSDGVTGATSDGFTIGGSLDYINTNTGNYVAWCWRMNGGTTATNNDGNVTTTVQANTKAGQSILLFTGTSSNSRTLGHGLTKKPGFVIVKRRENSQSWNTWGPFHDDGSEQGQYGALMLEGSGAHSNGSGALTYWYPSGMTTTTIGVGGASGNNNSGEDMMMWCFHDVKGYSAFNYYVGNNNVEGPYIHTGFRPRMLFIKRTDSTGNWECRDTERDEFNPLDTTIVWDSDTTEASSAASSAYPLDICASGFKIRTTSANYNASGGFYIYGAWGDVPGKYGNTFKSNYQ